VRAFVRLSLLLAACGGGPSSTAPTGESPVTPGAELAPMDDGVAAAAGDRAAFTFFVRPRRWPEVQRAVMSELASEPSGELARLLNAPLSELLPLMGGAELAAALGELRGVDGERPIIVRIGEGGEGGLEAIARVAQDPTVAPTGLRHVVAVPATDVAEARASLERAMRHVCAVADRFRCEGNLSVSFEVAGDWVFAVVGDLDAPLHAAAPAGVIARWTMDPRWPAALHVRPSAFQPAATQKALRTMLRARQVLEGDLRTEITAQGLAEVLMFHARTTPEAHEIQEMGLALRTEPASLAFVGRLSALAAQALSTAGAPSQPRTPQGPERFFRLRSGIDLVEAARLRPPLHGTEPGTGRAPPRLRRCGLYCEYADRVQPLAGARMQLFMNVPTRLNQHLSYEQDPTLAPGTLEALFDIQGVASATNAPTAKLVATLVPGVHFRATVEDGAFAGALGLRPDLPYALPVLEPASTSVTAEELACLERLQLAALDAVVMPASTAAEVRRQQHAEGRAAATEALACLTTPALRAEGEATLRAVDAIHALLAE